MRSVLVPAAIASPAVVGLAWFGMRDGNTVTTLRFSTGSESGEYYDFAKALATVAEQRADGILIEVIPSAGAIENAERLASGAADIGLIQSDTQAATSVRAIASIFPEILHIVARTDSGVESVPDVAGKRVALMPTGSGGNAVFARIMAHYGMDDADYTVTHMTPADAMAALQAGQVDVLARVIALGNAPTVPAGTDLAPTAGCARA